MMIDRLFDIPVIASRPNPSPKLTEAELPGYLLDTILPFVRADADGTPIWTSNGNALAVPQRVMVIAALQEVLLEWQYIDDPWLSVQQLYDRVAGNGYQLSSVRSSVSKLKAAARLLAKRLDDNYSVYRINRTRCGYMRVMLYNATGINHWEE